MTEKEFEKKYKEDVYLQKEIRDLIINIYGEDNLQKTFKLWVKGYYDTKNAFDVKNSHFKEKFQHYIKKEGIVLPDDFSDFIGWFEDVYPGLSFIEMQRQFQDNNTFIKFHDYTIRTCNNPNWTIQKEIEFLTNQKSESIPAPQPIKTKADILKEQLSQYGFFELEKVKTLSEQSKVSIIEKIAESGLPYVIAMFDYLQFIPYLEKKHFDSKYKLNREVSKWFDSDKEGRAVKGNISSLLKNTTENKDRYTAYKHKENVIKDYELLK